MNGPNIRRLLEKDTEYSSDQSLFSISLSDGQVSIYKPTMEPQAMLRLVDGHDPDNRHQVNIVVVRHRQVYPENAVSLTHSRERKSNETYSQIVTSRECWLQVLSLAEMLPSWLEMLHTNASACLRHISYSKNAEKGTVTKPAAIHYGLKVGAWVGCEFALYVREEVDTGRVFALCAGRSTIDMRKTLSNRLTGAGRMTAFHVMLIFMEIWAQTFTTQRWQLERKMIELEAATDPAKLLENPNPLTAQVSSRVWRTVALRPGVLIWASSCLCDIGHFLIRQLEDYRKLTDRLSEPEYQQIRDALSFQLALIEGNRAVFKRLEHRTDTHMNITRTVATEKDTQVSIALSRAAKMDNEVMVEISRLTKRDSEIMKAIALVTMIFLPATFTATFFSMVFFHVGDEAKPRLSVDRNIWLYPVVAVPFTTIMGIWYFGWFRRQSLLTPVTSSNQTPSSLEKL